MQARLKALFVEHGPVAVAVYVLLLVLTWSGFALAIARGFEPDGAAQNASVVTAAYVATKLTQPLRIGATLVLTPFATRTWRRLRGGSARSSGSDRQDGGGRRPVG